MCAGYSSRRAWQTTNWRTPSETSATPSPPPHPLSRDDVSPQCDVTPVGSTPHLFALVCDLNKLLEYVWEADLHLFAEKYLVGIMFMFIIILHKWFSEPDKQEILILIILQCYVILFLYSLVYFVWSVLDLLICFVVVEFFFLFRWMGTCVILLKFCILCWKLFCQSFRLGANKSCSIIKIGNINVIVNNVYWC
jgi:hypothetical protein